MVRPLTTEVVLQMGRVAGATPTCVRVVFNLTGGLYWLNRALFLKDAGRKLSRMDLEARPVPALSGKLVNAIG